METSPTLVLILVLSLSLLAGLLSPFLLAQRETFIAPTLSHATFLGLAISLSLFSPEQTYYLYALTLLITLTLATFLSHLSFKRHLPSDVLMGLFFSVSMGAGFLIFHLSSTNHSYDPHHYLSGDILLLDPADIFLILVPLSLVCGALFHSFSRWVYFVVDAPTARAAGQRTEIYHYAFIILLGLSIVSAVKVSGIIMANTMFLAPGLFALKIAKNLRGAFLASVLFSLISATAGLGISLLFDTPAGATMACFQCLLLFAGLGLGKRFS